MRSRRERHGGFEIRAPALRSLLPFTPAPGRRLGTCLTLNLVQCMSGSEADHSLQALKEADSAPTACDAAARRHSVAAWHGLTVETASDLETMQRRTKSPLSLFHALTVPGLVDVRTRSPHEACFWVHYSISKALTGFPRAGVWRGPLLTERHTIRPRNLIAALWQNARGWTQRREGQVVPATLVYWLQAAVPEHRRSSIFNVQLNNYFYTAHGATTTAEHPDQPGQCVPG